MTYLDYNGYPMQWTTVHPITTLAIRCLGQLAQVFRGRSLKNSPQICALGVVSRDLGNVEIQDLLGRQATAGEVSLEVLSGKLEDIWRCEVGVAHVHFVELAE